MSKAHRSAVDDIQFCDRRWHDDGEDDDVRGEHHCAGMIQPGQTHECRCCCGGVYRFERPARSVEFG